MEPSEINEDYFPPEVISIEGRDGPDRITSMDYIHNEVWFIPKHQKCANCNMQFQKHILCLHLGEKEVMVPCTECDGFTIFEKKWFEW